MITLFETARLSVRHFQPSDLDDFAALCADPLVMQYMGDGETLTRETVAYWIEVCQMKYHQRGYGTSAVIEKATGQFIGYCGVVRAPENNFDEIIYAFIQTAWGRGYASEVAGAMLDYVFANFHLVDSIYATIHPENAASIKVMEKIGMQYEKTVQNEDLSQTLFFVIHRPTPA